MSRGAWVRIKYISENTGREVGHYGHHQGRQSVRELFQREYIDPGKVTFLEVNGNEIEPIRDNVVKLLKG